MVDVDGGCQFTADSAQVDWLDLRVGSDPALSLHSSSKPGELHRRRSRKGGTGPNDGVGGTIALWGPPNSDTSGP